MPYAQCALAQWCPIVFPIPNAHYTPTTRHRRARGLAISALLWLGLGSLFLFGLAFCVVGTTATFMSIASSWESQAQGGDAQPTMVASHMYSPRLEHTQHIWRHGNATGSARLWALDAASGRASVAWLPPLASDADVSWGAAAAVAAIERATGSSSRSREARQHQAARVHASPSTTRSGPAAGGRAGGGAARSSGALVPAASST